ncbi:MAG: site-specific DNA-methyltransferase [Oscillospiraceae bacterium]|jgi:adenine-specific DNA-methyltransferase|nr:site-specific DNA-methyltransferase [Oscillospiraceae bacterium]
MSEKIDGLSMDIAAPEQEKLRAAFPHCFTEGKLDERKLFELLGTFDTLDENDREKYEFRWKGKQEALQLAGKRSAGTLRPCPDESVDWDSTRNLYIEGDNLEVLKLLQTSYYRKVKMIYIDPPYNTGNDFVYADDFADPLARYREVTRQTTKSNPESMGRFHTNWLNMMLPRLRLAANLLRDDGVIFISIDDTEITNLRKICDEIFGEENFLGIILWKKKTNGNNMGVIPPVHDYIVVYGKQVNEIGEIGYEITEEFIQKTYSNPDNDPRGAWTTMDLSANHKGPHFPITNPVTGQVWDPPEGRYWVFNEAEVKRRIEDGRIIFGKTGNTRPVQKVFAAERLSGKIRAESWWDNHGMNADATEEIRDLFGQGKLFTHPKPSKLIYNLVKIATSNDDIIIDFFSGSATTAHAVMQLNAEDGGNRRFILVQIPEMCDEKSEAYKAGYKTICEIGKERIRRAGAKIKGEQDGQVKLGEDEKSPLDTGFRVFKLDSSNLKQWDNSPITGENAPTLFEQRILAMLDIIKPDRADLDVVYEVMLKLGQDLCEPILAIDVGNGRQVYGVGADVTFMVCLAPNITEVEAKIMAEYAPGRIVFADQCFRDSTDKSNVKLTLRDRGITIRVL